MATTFYSLQVQSAFGAEWVTTDFRKGKKGSVIAEAEKRRAKDKHGVRVLTDKGTVVLEIPAPKKRNITRFTKPYTLTIAPVLDALPEELEGYVFAYTRPRRGWSVLRNMEVDPSERYAVVDDYLQTIEFFETTRDAGRFMTDTDAPVGV